MRALVLTAKVVQNLANRMVYEGQTQTQTQWYTSKVNKLLNRHGAGMESFIENLCGKQTCFIHAPINESTPSQQQYRQALTELQTYLTSHLEIIPQLEASTLPDDKDLLSRLNRLRRALQAFSKMWSVHAETRVVSGELKY